MISIYRPEGMYRPDRVPDAKVLYIEPKADGRFVRIDTQGDCPIAHGHDISNTTGKYTHLPTTLARQLVRRNEIPPQTIVEGELIWPGHPASEVVTAIKECPNELTFLPFTSPMWRGENLTATLYALGRSRTCCGLPDVWVYADFIRYGPPSIEYLLRLHKRMWPESEGLVIKQYWYANWWKLKPVKTVDLVVAGFTLGTAGKWCGLPNSMRLKTAAGTDCGKCGNMSDAVHMQIPDHVGQVVEVAFDCLTSDNKLRFPRFVRWREDKAAWECKELCDQI